MSSNFTVSYLYKLRDEMSGKIDKIRKQAVKMSKDIERSGKRMSISWQGVGQQAKQVGKSAMIAGASITAPLALMAREAMKFEKGVAELATLIPTKTLGGVKEEVSSMLLGISKSFGKGASNVTASAYQAVSAGIPATKKALGDFLAVASKASVGGVTSLETAVDGITSTMNAFKAEGLSATQISDKMFTAVRLGKTTFEEMSKSMFQVAPIASGLKIQFGEVTSAIASVTAKGVPTRVVTTQMKAMLTELSKSSSKVSKVFKVISGQSFPEFIKGGGSMQNALNMIRAKADEAGVEMADVFSSVEASAVAMNLTGTNAKAFSVALNETKNSAGATSKAYKKMAESASFKWDKAVAGLKATSITLGTKLLPHLIKVANKFSGFMEGISKFVDKNPMLSSAIIATTAVLGVLLTGLGTIGFVSGSVIAGVLAMKAGFLAMAGGLGLTTTSFSAFAVSVWASTAALLANPITWIVVAVIALGVAVWRLIKNWDIVVAGIVSGIQTLWAKMKSFASGIMSFFSRWKYIILLIVPALIPIYIVAKIIKNNWNKIKTVLLKVWDIIKFIGTYIGGYFVGLWENLKVCISGLGEQFSLLWDEIKSGAESAFSWIASSLDWLNAKLKPMFAVLDYITGSDKAVKVTTQNTQINKTAEALGTSAGQTAKVARNIKTKGSNFKEMGSSMERGKVLPRKEDIPSGKKVDVNLKSDIGGILKIEIDNKGKATVKKVEQKGDLGFQVGG